jgi:AcrR family transcriptional regulator
MTARTGPSATAPDQASGTSPATAPAPAADRASGTGTSPGRVNQKARTRAAIVQAVQDLARAGAEITMPAVAKAALVSEATAYRYFPDLMSLLREADARIWPDPAEALAPVAGSDDPVERVGYAAEVLLTGVLARQSLVRATIAAAITRPDLAAGRPGHRFALIDHALTPLTGTDPQVLAQLKLGLAVVVSAEALFVLTDLCGLSPDDAIASTVSTARSLTAAAIRPGEHAAALRSPR